VRAVLSRAGLFANRRRSLAGFDVLARHHFGIPIGTVPFAGGWRTLPEASRTRVGKNGRNHLLGATSRDAGQAIAGTRWRRLGKQVAQIIEDVRGGIDGLAIDHAAFQAPALAPRSWPSQL